MNKQYDESKKIHAALEKANARLYKVVLSEYNALLRFITEGDETFFKTYLKVDIYSEPDFVAFISPFFASAYDKLLFEKCMAGEVDEVTNIVSIPLITNVKYHDRCYKSLYAYYRNIEYELDDMIGALSFTDLSERSRQIGIVKTVAQKFYLPLLNVLPPYFQAVRNKLASAIAALARALNEPPRCQYESALMLIEIANAIMTDGDVREMITEYCETIRYNVDFEKNERADESHQKGTEQKNERQPEVNDEVPLTNAPILATINGIGRKIYGDTLYFVFAYIPIFPIARYSFNFDGRQTYQFYKKHALRRWQRVWNYSLLVGLILACLYWLTRS